MEIITSGSAFIDIDAYGGMKAYAELRNLGGKPAIAASSAPLNESITPTICSWGAILEDYKPSDTNTFTLVDVSDPKFFDPIVRDDDVVGIIDHHTGFESYWRERLGDAANIEFVGAACTLVYERWQQAGKLQDMSSLSARLLICGILDNTLNFRAGVTTSRDIEAHDQLMKRADLPKDWPAQYFADCQRSITADLETTLQNDTKTILDDLLLPASFGQVVIWNARELLEQRPLIAATMGAMQRDWAVNLVSIEEGTSYFLADNSQTQAKLANLLGITFTDGVAKTDHLWLRKEVLKEALAK